MKNFYVWCEDRGESLETAEVFESVSPNLAAQKWALEHDESNDSEIAGDERVLTVFVQDEFCQKSWEFLVSGFYKPVYCARLKVSTNQGDSCGASIIPNP